MVSILVNLNVPENPLLWPIPAILYERVSGDDHELSEPCNGVLNLGTTKLL